MNKSAAITHFAYLVTITFKGFVGLVEFVAGLVIAIAGAQKIHSFVFKITAPEVYSGGHAVQLIRDGAQALSQSPTRFLIFYLLVHGMLKMAITIVLLRGKGVWVFPFACCILTGFVAYMSYELSLKWSYWLLGLAVFDSITVALVLNEWRNWNKHVAPAYPGGHV